MIDGSTDNALCLGGPWNNWYATNLVGRRGRASCASLYIHALPFAWGNVLTMILPSTSWLWEYGATSYIPCLFLIPFVYLVHWSVKFGIHLSRSVALKGIKTSKWMWGPPLTHGPPFTRTHKSNFERWCNYASRGCNHCGCITICKWQYWVPNVDNFQEFLLSLVANMPPKDTIPNNMYVKMLFWQRILFGKPCLWLVIAWTQMNT